MHWRRNKPYIYRLHFVIFSFFPDSDAEGITLNELIKISRKEFSEDDAENTIRNALDIFYEQG